MKESVSGILNFENQVYFIKRQNYLNVFPGYFSAPGGKVDSNDNEFIENEKILSFLPPNISLKVFNALIRELKEELNINLVNLIEDEKIISIKHIATAITPEFNPYRFKNYYFLITLCEQIKIELDTNEAEYGVWKTPLELLDLYENGKILAVPPAISLIRSLKSNLSNIKFLNVDLNYNPDSEVPMIESINGVRQILPLSETFPPANRTNAFIIGDGEDDSPKVLIDPSPKDDLEFKKFLNVIDKIGYNCIFLTHHHPDHYKYATEIARLKNIKMMMSFDTFNRIKKNQGENYFENINIELKKEGDFLTKSLKENVIVYEIPGHDEGQLGLAPESLNWFLVGDLIQSIGTVVISAPEGDMNKYFKSLERVISLNPKNIIPSHGIIMGGIFKLEETLKHRKLRENQIREFMAKSFNISEICRMIYTDLPNNLIPYAIKTIESHIEKIKNDNQNLDS